MEDNNVNITKVLFDNENNKEEDAENEIEINSENQDDIIIYNHNKNTEQNISISDSNKNIEITKNFVLSHIEKHVYDKLIDYTSAVYEYCAKNAQKIEFVTKISDPIKPYFCFDLQNTVQKSAVFHIKKR